MCSKLDDTSQIDILPNGVPVRNVGRNFVGAIWPEPDADPDFIMYVEAILNCECCQNNYTDIQHFHNATCAPDYVEFPTYTDSQGREHDEF